MTDVPSSQDAIPLDVEACLHRLVAIVRQGDPAMLAQEEHRAYVMEQIQAFRRWVHQAIAPHARPTRVVCKRATSACATSRPCGGAFCLLSLIRRHCRAIAFASDAILWDEVDARIWTL